jgi:DNA-binding PadR family transcriptional regulator
MPPETRTEVCRDTLIADTLRDMRDPLREPTFLILAALAPQPLHGYAIIGEVAELSGGRMTLRPGTLYGALDRLAEEGLLEPDREEVVDGRLRRYYRLTDAGAAVLEQEAARLQHNADAARGRLARRPPHRVVSQPAGGLA